MWVDSNHNGISEQTELRSLAAAGVVRLSLDYNAWKRVDQHGNEFVFKGEAWINTPQGIEHTIMPDVDFVGALEE